MNLLYRTPPQPGYVTVISREDAGLDYLEFGLLRLDEGGTWESNTGGYEVALVLLGGRCDVESDSDRWENIGERGNVFEGRATAVYLAPGRPYQVTAGAGGVEIGVCKSVAEAGGGSGLVRPADVKSRTVGAANWRREVQDILGAEVAASRLLVGETYSEPGAWSSYPPHKHDVMAPPQEHQLEEIYYYRVQPAQGFGVQRVYSADGRVDECYAVRDGDAVAIPQGYHPVAAAPGYKLYYLWMLAGPERLLVPHDDPDHAWVHGLE